MCDKSQQGILHNYSQSSDIKPTFHFSSYCVLTCFNVFFLILSKLSLNFRVKTASKRLTRDKQEKDKKVTPR